MKHFLFFTALVICKIQHVYAVDLQTANVSQPISVFVPDMNLTIENEEADSLVYPVSMKMIHINDLIVHDPCILADKKSDSYYIYEKFSPTRFAGMLDAPKGKAGVFYQKSSDLIYWTRPEPAFIIPDNFWGDEESGPWAPEVHAYKGKYYMFTTFNAWSEVMDHRAGRPKITKRASQILVSDSPTGPFVPFSNEPATPQGEMTLDATFYNEDGQPWMIYCNEWVQMGNGLIKAIKLKDDLSKTIGDPITLLDAGKVEWTKKEINYQGVPTPGVVTDGPYFYRTKTGVLTMIWSSWSKTRQYALAVATSESGKVTGPWKYDSDPILLDDRGHGMIFRDFDGRLLLCVHRYFHYPLTRVQLYELKDIGSGIQIVKQVAGSE